MVEQAIDQRRRWRVACEIYRQQQATVWVKPEGRSMRPLFAPDVWALVEFGAAPKSVGDIFLFRRADLVISHRLVAQAASGETIAKGDAEAYCDAPVDSNDILGVVRALRHGPSGSPTSAACTGWPARTIARISWWGGRGAASARRAATALPGPLRRIAIRAITPLARVVALALFAPIGWAAQIHAVIDHGNERR